MTQQRPRSIGADHGDTAEGRDPLLGAKLGGYEIKRALGRGGSADVYVAVQTSLDREVALKVLREDPTGTDREHVDAFLSEARAAASLNHPCLVQVYDVDEVDGRHFLSMELLPGGNLAQWIKKHGPMPWRQAVAIAMDVADALQCAHDRGILHHDVKPANILLTRDVEAKLADLGLAAVRKNAGTKAFMSPERILKKDADARSDIYSLGCTLYTMLTAEPLFNHPSSKEMLAAHVREAPPKLRRSGVDVPEELENLVAKMVAKDPGMRPASAAKVADLLEWVDAAAMPDAATPAAAPETRQVTASPSGPGAVEVRRAGARRRRSVRRRREIGAPWGVVVGLVLVALIVIGLLWAYRRFVQG